jgi:DNA-directed RNA polymerase specialized sigma24 family protein
MSSQMSHPDNESSLVARCRQGDPDALGELWEIYNGSLLEMLLSRGAERTEAEDVLADLWAACIPGWDDRPSILKKFSGKCPLQGWLENLATIRWVDRKPKRSGAASTG